jgi:hypothetical protein
MDSISTARDFFINQQGLSSDQAEQIISKGMEAYNERTQPQSMMQMASGGIARLGYQMGGSPMGVEAMPMDTGQSLQVPQQMPTNFSSAQSITMNPLLNYGQPQIGQAGGTPLSMNRGGIARLGYESGGVTLPSQGSEMSQMGQMDQEQALQTIIQILIENGIPPEQAQQLALQILQIFAQGGEPAVEEFANQLEQAEQGEQGDEQVQGMAKGGIAGLYPRQGYFVGKIAKAVTGAVKGVASAVKSVVKSPIGKLALTAAAIYAGGGGFGLSPGGFSLFGGPAGPGLLGGAGSFNLGSSVIGQGLFGTPALGDALVGGSKGLFGNLGLTGGFGSSLGTGTGIMGSIGKVIGSPLTTVANLASGDKGGILGLVGAGGIGAALGSLLGAKTPEETDEQYQQRLQSAGPYLEQYYKNLNPNATPDQVSQFVKLNTAEYGGLGQGNTFAKGGIIPPARQIEGGVIELDARKTGGYIPYGKKERVDDVPAMLAKDEFVFTSRAVKAAGGGSAKRGAARMYALMKQLESKGMKMERGARA